MSSLREDMEEGELSSGPEDEPLGQYTPLERPTNPKPNFQSSAPSQGELGCKE